MTDDRVSVAIFMGKSPVAATSWQYPGIAGVSPVITPQRAVGTALPMDTLGTSIDWNATISGRTPTAFQGACPSNRRVCDELCYVQPNRTSSPGGRQPKKHYFIPAFYLSKLRCLNGKLIYCIIRKTDGKITKILWINATISSGNHSRYGPPISFALGHLMKHF